MRRRWHLVAMGSASIALAIANPFGAAHADSGPKFGSYTIAATAPGWEMYEDEPSANAHPEGGTQAPYSTSALSTGGLGYGLSSVAWPGTRGALAGRLSAATMLLKDPTSVADTKLSVLSSISARRGWVCWSIRRE